MNGRSQLLRSPLGLVEDVVCPGSRRRPGPEDFSPDFQLAFPYRGVFVWHVGRDAVVGDTNQILFVTGGEAYRASDPRPGGYAEVIVTPAMTVLTELTEAGGFAPREHPLFRRRSRRATPALQQMCARLLHRAWANPELDALGAEEAMLALLRVSLELEPLQSAPAAKTRRLINRTQAFLQSEFTRSLKLSEVARAVGASPAYLTDAFRRFEGLSLQRYVTQLRLARALIELPDVEDLTRLALDLGFSSHSHFTFAFRRAFGCTPSRFRETVRTHRRPSRAAISRATRWPDSKPPFIQPFHGEVYSPAK